MSSLNSSVLFVGLAAPPRLALDCASVLRVDQVKPNSNADVIVIPVLFARSEAFTSVFETLLKKRPFIHLILIAGSNTDESTLRTLIHEFPVFRVLESFVDPALESSLLEALERAQWIKQNEQLRTLIHEQNETLKQLYQQLEERVGKRTRFLEEARRKSLLAQARWEAIRQATVAIHQSSGIAIMETKLLEVLSSKMQVAAVRILPGLASVAPRDPRWEPFAVHRVSLFNNQNRPEGVILFFRTKEHPFTGDEKEFFQQLAETLNPALHRLGTLKTRENFKEEWEATFNAVADPVAILNSNYEIVQTNSAFLKRAGHGESVMGLRCYQALFHRETPCPNCHRGENFRLEQKKETFDVSSQTVWLSPDEEVVFVNQYHDVTEQMRMEKRIMESARLAELGTIGSSIAHELNNPLGGILSYVQLLKMDLPGDSAILDDIREMEKGVLRCRDIVQNLLNFTRSPGDEEKRQVDLRDVIKRAVAILELKTRSHGIEIKSTIPETAVLIEGHFNQLTQALQNVLQSALVSIQEKMLSQRGFQPVLEINLQIQVHEISLVVLDNGRGLESAPSLEIPLAKRILLEHGAGLEISFHQRSLRMAKISFSRPVLPA